jgi:AcrR family transcriptional regulator
MDLTGRQLEIIEAAGKILTVSGVGGLTIKRLAQEMEFSEAAIYRHFKNKEAILIKMLQYLGQNMDERFSNMDHTLPVIDRFKILFDSQIEFFSKNKYFVVVVFSDGLLEDSEPISEEINKIMKVKMKHLLPIITDGQKAGLFTRDVRSEELLHIIVGAFRLQMYKWRVSHFEMNLERVVKHLITSLLTIIKTK